MAGVPRVYRGLGEGALANYDYVDIANGLGYVEFKGYTSRPAGVLTYHLGKEVMETGYASTASIVSTERFAILVNEDTSGAVTFQTSEFNLPRILEGKVFVNFTLDTTLNNADSHIPSATLYLNDTELGTASGASIAGSAIIHTYNLSFDVSKQKIKRGDVIKLKISSVSTDAGVSRVLLEHDPLNRDEDSYTFSGGDVRRNITASDYPTELNVFVPFRIDL